MQISRHWRMKPLRYRLEAMVNQKGEVAFQKRTRSSDMNKDTKVVETEAQKVVTTR